MENYQSNSDKSRAVRESETEEKKFAPVVKGKTTVKKETVGDKFANTFLAETSHNVGNYIWNDVLKPAIVDTVVDMITNTANMFAYGSSSGRRGSKSNGSKTSYSQYYRSGDNRSRSDNVIRGGNGSRGLANIIFDTRGDAQECLFTMQEAVSKYGNVSVAEYYEMADADDCAKYTDNSFGWFDLDDAQVIRDHDGFKIRLPRPESLK